VTACGLAVLSSTLAYAVFNKGGVWLNDWAVCLLAIGVLAVLYFFRAPRDHAPPLDRTSQWLLLAFAGLAVLQVLPLPLPLIHLLSPSRADLLTATAPVLGAARFGPLSTTPALSLEHLARIAGYLLVFLLIRELTWQLTGYPWLPALPLVVIAALQGALGLFQDPATGTYVNRDHFAGFLEMCLPFAVLYPVAILKRTRSRYESPAMPALKACGLLLIAARIFLAILQSLSRAGFLASLASLLVIGCVASRRWLPIAALATLTLAGVVLLPSDALIQRFATLASTDAISSDMRVGMWRDTLGLIKAFPLFGCGLGAYESTFPRYQTVAPMYTIDFAHNDYLQYLAELGALGFLIGLMFVLRLFAQTLRGAINEPSIDRRYVSLACTGSFVAILLHSFVDFNLYIPANAMLLAWIAGIGAAHAANR
jgi:O-antigen ligase